MGRFGCVGTLVCVRESVTLLCLHWGIGHKHTHIGATLPRVTLKCVRLVRPRATARLPCPMDFWLGCPTRESLGVGSWGEAVPFIVHSGCHLNGLSPHLPAGPASNWNTEPHEGCPAPPTLHVSHSWKKAGLNTSAFLTEP
jgi:hypothetical protein